MLKPGTRLRQHAFRARSLAGVTRKWVYADSVGGNDANDGLTPAAAKQTLSAAQAVLAAGWGLRLARGSYWREQLNVPANNIYIGVYGSGAMPVIDGADVVTSGWTQPDSVTYPNVWSLSWTRSDPGGGSGNLGYWEAGSRTTFRTTLANLQAGSNGDWHTTSLTAQTSTVSIRSAADPNSDGVLREVGKRGHAVLGHAQVTGVTRTGLRVVGPIEMRRCVAHYNAFAGAPGEGRGMLLRDGNIHHTVTEGELLEDVVCAEIDPNTTAGSPITHYRSNGSGFNPVSRRCLVLLAGGAGRGFHSAFTAHGSSPAVSDSYLVEQFYVRGAGVGGGGVNSVTRDGYVEDWNDGAIDAGSGGGTRTVVRVLARDTVATSWVNGTQCFRRASSAATYAASHCAMMTRKGHCCTGVSGGTQPTHNRCSFYTTSSGCLSGGAPAATYCVLYASAHPLSTVLNGYAGDYNVFYSSAGGTGPLLSWNGNTYLNPATSMGLFQAASGQDANSVYLKTADQVSGNGIAFWLGVSSGANAGPPDGDWRINPSAKVYKADGSSLTGVFADGVTPITAAGPQEHWDFNLKAVVSGPPTRFPVPPATVAEMRTYLEDPNGWDWYP